MLPSGIDPGGCFPRARPQSPRENHSVGSSDTCYSRRSHHPPLTRTGDVVEVNFCTRTTIANGSKCNTSEGNTRRLLGEQRHRRGPAARSHEEAHQPPTESVVFFRNGHYTRPQYVMSQFIDFVSEEHLFRWDYSSDFYKKCTI